MPLRPEALDVGSVVDQCLAGLLPLARAHRVELATDIAPESAPLLADAEALAQVLDNLLSNAIKYNRLHGRVTVHYDAGEAGGVIAVEDSGIGLTPEQLGRLFEPFNRLGAERTGVRGTGLGLVITRQLVQAMDGELRVQSTPGAGTRVEVRLPLAPATVPVRVPVPSDARLPPAPAGDDEFAATRVVLYVEDDEVNTMLMEQVFMGRPGWRLVTAPTGEAGLEAARRLQPDAVLLDLHLPDMSGFEVLQQLRADPLTRRTPCIAVSADAMPAQVEHALSHGFVRYWTKPLKVGSVLHELGDLFAALDAADRVRPGARAALR